MATAVEQIGRSVQAGDGQNNRVRRWFVRNATDEADAIAAVAAAAPATLGGLVLDGIGGPEKVAGGYELEANYGVFKRRQPPATGDSQFNFEVSVQPVKVVVPVTTPTVYGTDPPAVELIGEQGDGSPPSGVEVFEPNHEESETHYLDDAFITPAYKALLKSLVGKTNDSSFKGNDVGEALLRGVSGSRRGESDWEVTYRWSVRENQAGLTIAGITGISKKGWEYLWPIHEIEEDANGRHLTNRVTHVAVAQVFRSVNLGLLGIGT